MSFHTFPFQAVDRRYNPPLFVAASRAIGLDCTTCNHYTTNDNRRSGNFFISEPPVIFTHVNFILFRRNLLYLTESLCHGRNANDHERNRRFRQKKAIIICNRIDRCQ